MLAHCAVGWWIAMRVPRGRHSWFMFAAVAALTLRCSRWDYEVLEVQVDSDGSGASGGEAGAPAATGGAHSTSLVSGTDGSMSGDGGSLGETTGSSNAEATGSGGQ